MLERVIEYCRQQLSSDPSLPDYDYEFIQRQEYKHIATYVTISVSADETRDAIRCQLCGELFDKEEMASAVDHVGSHSSDRTGEVDVFETDRGVGFVVDAEARDFAEQNSEDQTQE